jgi:parvulin-like peptidyl-prolyl isomerase
MPRLVALLATLGLVLAACGGGSSAVAATVDGTEITVGQLDGLRPGGASSAPQAASDLELLITTEIVRSGLDELGVEVTDDAIAAAEDEFVAGVEASGSTLEDFLAENEVTEELFDVAIFQQVAQEQLIDHFSESVEVTDEDVEAQFNAELQSRSEVCAAHILIGVDAENGPDAAEAQTIAEDVFALTIEDGADFAALAQEYSTGPSGPDGGDLGCASPASYVPAFGQATLDAELGEPFGPVQTEFGWHIILVNDRTVPELADIEAELTESVAAIKASQELTDWYTESVAAADVTVDEEFGTWEEDPATGVFGVVPPAAS